MVWIIQNWEEILGVVFALLVVAEFIVNLTPTEKDNSILLKVKQFIDAIVPNRYKNPQTGETGEFKCTGGVIDKIRQRRRDKKQQQHPDK